MSSEERGFYKQKYLDEINTKIRNMPSFLERSDEDRIIGNTAFYSKELKVIDNEEFLDCYIFESKLEELIKLKQEQIRELKEEVNMMSKDKMQSHYRRCILCRGKHIDVFDREQSDCTHCGYRISDYFAGKLLFEQSAYEPKEQPNFSKYF